MAEMQMHEPGSFCWADLATGDAEGAKRFYGELFGWQFRDLPAGEGMVYSMALIDGKEVAALYRLDVGCGVPPHWQPYVSAANTDAVAVKARSLGGTVIDPPFDVFAAGRMAVLQDPAGAVLAVWEPRGHFGARLMSEPGAICWNELESRDVEKSEPFYTGLFGWGSRLAESGPLPYTVFTLDGVDEAGMMPLPAEGGDIPSHWLVYFMVADCDRSAAQAGVLGARIVVDPADIPSVGRFAVLQDPQGAAFAIFQTARPS